MVRGGELDQLLKTNKPTSDRGYCRKCASNMSCMHSSFSSTATAYNAPFQKMRGAKGSPSKGSPSRPSPSKRSEVDAVEDGGVRVLLRDARPAALIKPARGCAHVELNVSCSWQTRRKSR